MNEPTSEALQRELLTTAISVEDDMPRTAVLLRAACDALHDQQVELTNARALAKEWFDKYQALVRQ